MFFLKGSWSKEMTSPRNEKPNSSFFLLNVSAQASRGLSLGCALLMTNAIWRFTTRIWLKQFSAAARIKECHCVRRRRTQSIPQGAVTNVVARLPSMLRRFLPDSSHSFGWLHICAVFVAILNFTLWGNAHARIHCHVINCLSKAKCDEDQACARGYQRLLKTGPISEENLNSKFNLSVKWVSGV